MRRSIFFGIVASALVVQAFNADIALAAASPVQNSAPIPEDQLSDEPVLSAESIEIAELTGIRSICKSLQIEQMGAKASPPKDSTEKILRNQRIIYLHEKIGQYVQTANLEVNSVTGKLNSGMAELADHQASISDARARMLRRNNFINLFSGGITKIGGYTSALTPASPIPTNVLEIFDGGVQTTLSALTMKQLKSEEQLSRAKPAILTTFLEGNNLSTKIFPSSVWTYLCHKDPTRSDNKTRRRALVDYWLKEGRLRQPGAKNNDTKRVREMAGVKMPMNDLDDTVAMMSDLKSVVAGMENSLMELSQVLKISFKDDPPI